jgi:hypothetical protein
MYKIIGADQKEYGPVTAEKIQQWIAQGRVNAQTRIQAEGGEWKPLGEFPEFATAAASAAPPLSTTPLGPPAPPAPPTKTSGLAVASLVLGILGLFSCGATALVGLILGIVSLVKVKKSNGALGGQGLALAGTIISAAFLLMLPIWAAMMLPALAKAKQRALTIQCVNNTKQLALAVRIYSGDNNDHFPQATNWCDAIKTDVGSEKVFQCPAGDATERCHYAYNARLAGMEQKSINPSTVLLFETGGGWNVSGGPELMLHASRHGRLYIVAFADGSVQQMTSSQLAGLRWNP